MHWCLVLLEDEASGLTDVVNFSALCRRTAPAIVNSGSVLDLGQTAARG